MQYFKEGLAIQNYLDNALKGEDFNVTEEEAQNFYEIYNQQSEEEIPPYEELESQIINLLQQQKRQEAIDSIVQELREDAIIEYN